MKDYCVFAGKDLKHPTKLWRVIYLSNGDEQKKQCKDIPAFWIGKRTKPTKELTYKEDEQLGEHATIRQLGKNSL